MSIRWHGDARMEEAKDEMARRCLRGIVYFVAQHQERVGVSVFAEDHDRKTRSKPGEYPRKETGLGQANIIHWPETPEQVKDNGLKVRAGSRKINLIAGLPHLMFLSMHRERLGYQKTLADTRGQIKALIEAK